MAEEIPGDLLRRLRCGDSAAVAEFGQLRRPQLSAYIDRQLGAALRSKIEPDDLVQEVLLRGVRNAQLFTAPDRDPFGVLCHLAQECIVDAHRRYVEAQKRAAAREVPIHGGGSPDATGGGGLINCIVAGITSPSAAFSRDQRGMRVDEALRSLPEEHREALRLRYVDGMATKEIAQRLNKTDGAVRVMLSRSLDKLQRMLGEE